MTTTSKEYAEALFELAAGDRVLEETSDGLVTVISALRSGVRDTMSMLQYSFTGAKSVKLLYGP